MKTSVFTLVVLLHLCHSYKLNMTLNKGIFRQLKKLEELNNNSKLNITSPETMLVPTYNMQKRASSCVSVFVQNLSGILNNVTVEEANASLVEELQGNLLILDPHQQHDDKCTLQVKQAGSIFHPYIRFMMKLTNSKKR